MGMTNILGVVLIILTVGCALDLLFNKGGGMLALLTFIRRK